MEARLVLNEDTYEPYAAMVNTYKELYELRIREILRQFEDEHCIEQQIKFIYNTNELYIDYLGTIDDKYVNMIIKSVPSIVRIVNNNGLLKQFEGNREKFENNRIRIKQKMQEVQELDEFRELKPKTIRKGVLPTIKNESIYECIESYNENIHLMHCGIEEDLNHIKHLLRCFGYE